METRRFKVAGHVFGVTLKGDALPWSALGQYEPFATEEDNCLFTLEQANSGISEELETVYDPELEPGEPSVRIFRGNGHWVIKVAPDSSRPVCGTLILSDDYRDGRLHFESDVVADCLFAVNNALMVMFAFATATLGTLEIHASVIVNGGRAFPFLARSGTGKSTHSSLWLKHIPGSRLLNDDNPAVRVWPDGSIICYGTPWSGKTPCYRNESAPLGALVRIRRCTENRITPLSIIESYALLYSSCSGFKADRKMADGLHATLEKVVGSIPAYVLDCRPDEEAARVCSNELLRKK